MRIKLGNELIPLNLLVFILAAAVIFFPSNSLRIVLGIPFLLFFPGYVLMAALFPRKGGVGGFERVALSFGMSIAVVPIMGLLLNYTPWGVRLEPVLYSIVLFILIASIIAWFRRKRLTPPERFSIEFHLAIPGWEGGTWNKVLSIALVVTIAGAIGTLGYVLATPKVGEKFTEFYILGLDGKLVNYPLQLGVGEEGRVTVGIINREQEPATYWVEVRIGGVKHNEVEPAALEHNEQWEEIVSFTPHQAGDKQKVEFLLYKQGQIEVYDSLHLWVDVT